MLDKYNNTTITYDIYDAEAAGDPYPGISNNTALTDATTPAAVVYRGEYISKPITEITEDTENITVSFKFMGGNDTGINNVIRDNMNNPNIYSIDGRHLGNDINKLGKGIYIINKKKVIL